MKLEDYEKALQGIAACVTEGCSCPRVARLVLDRYGMKYGFGLLGEKPLDEYPSNTRDEFPDHK